MADKIPAPKVGDMVDPSSTITAGQDKMISGMGLASTAITGIMAVGTVLDIVSNVSDNREAKKMKKEQERNLVKKEQRTNRAIRKKHMQTSGPFYQPGMALDMFDQATGHTRYGASKLPGL